MKYIVLYTDASGNSNSQGFDDHKNAIFSANQYELEDTDNTTEIIEFEENEPELCYE
jgi:hypothetical protein